MDDLPKTTEPEYKSWPLEKLQSEYWKLNLHYLAHQIRMSDMEHKVEKVNELIAIFKELTGEE